MDKNLLLQKLPPFLHRYTTIKKNQSVFDIVKEVLAAHEIFASDYDRITADFDFGSNEEIARRLFNFLKSNVAYEIESEESQTTKSPSALLVQGIGDCKHYAGFIAGVLDALTRRGRKINWNYRFASYNLFDSEPGHVFVILHDKGKEFWIDPVLKIFNERLEPTFVLDKKPKQMLSRVSGIYDVAADTIFFDDEDRQLSPELLQSINLLWHYGIISTSGINDALINKLSSTLSDEQFKQIADARILLQQQAIGGFISDVWRGVKKVTLAAPRNAYLSLVALNVFGYGTKLAKAIYQADGVTFDEPNKKRIYDFWNSLGGDWHNLHNAIDSGKKKKAILGQANKISGPEVAAWVATATAIIAAITPIVKSILESKQVDPGIMNDPSLYGGYPYPSTYSGSSGIMSFIQNNPFIVAGAAAAGIYFFTKKRRA